MLVQVIIVVIVFFYVSLFIELFFYNIPSVVSTKEIFNLKNGAVDNFSETIKRYLTWSPLKKVLVFVLPLLFVYILHFAPAYFLYDIINNNVFPSNSIILSGLSIFLIVLGRVVSHLYLFAIYKIKTKAYEGFVNEGVFKFSRNPGLIGLYLSFLGFVIMKPSAFLLFCYLVYILHMHFKIKMEENYLTNKHGEEYSSYLEKTRRYL